MHILCKMSHVNVYGQLSGYLKRVASSAHAASVSHARVLQFSATPLRWNHAGTAQSDSQSSAADIRALPDDEIRGRSLKNQSPEELCSSHKVNNSSTSGDGAQIKAPRNKIKSHLYSSIYPWSSKNELVDILMQSQLFDNGSFLVLNKPFGVGQINTGSKVTYGPAPPPFTLNDVLPIMQELTRTPHLKIALAPEKWQSGVLVLAKTEKALHRISNCKHAAPGLQVCARKFWLLTRNRAYPRDKPYTVAALRTATMESGAKVGVLEFTPSKNLVKQHRVDRFYATHDTLSESGTTEAALMQVSVTRTMHHSARIWLAHHLAPALGDHLYGGRVAYLLDTPVPVPHTRASLKSVYPFELLKKLDLTSSTQSLMPLMMHLRTVTLPRYYVGRIAKQLNYDLGCYTCSSRPDGSSPNPRSNAATDEISIKGAFDKNTIESVDAAFSSQGMSDDSIISNTNSKEIANEGGSVEGSCSTELPPSAQRSSLIFTAPVPQHFSWTMERLNISLPST